MEHPIPCTNCIYHRGKACRAANICLAEVRDAIQRGTPEPPLLYGIPLLPSADSIKILSDAEVEALFIEIRWPDAIRCPQCATTNIYAIRRGGWRCSAKHDFSLTAGTPFANRKLPLRIALTFISLVQRDTGEVAISRIALEHGLGYKTTYCLVGKAREFLLHGAESESRFVGYMSRDKAERPRRPRGAILMKEPKLCPQCRELKPQAAFAPKSGPAGDWGLRVAVCKQCLAAKQSEQMRADWAIKKAEDAERPIIKRTAAQLLQRRGGQPWWNRGAWWTSQEKHDLVTLVEAGVSPDKVSAILRRPAKAAAWQARDLLHGLSPAWRALITPKRLIVPATPRLLVYPYLRRLSS